MKPLRLSRRRMLASSLAGLSFPALLQAAEQGVGKEVPWLADVQRRPKRSIHESSRCQLRTRLLMLLSSGTMSCMVLEGSSFAEKGKE